MNCAGLNELKAGFDTANFPAPISHRLSFNDFVPVKCHLPPPVNYSTLPKFHPFLPAKASPGR
jgi:hypothetical protein